MLRSLFSGISGLRAHQTLLDVVGNNIANVNTTGYKESSVQFEDTLSQLLTSAGAASTTAGTAGTNAAQVGLGVKTAGITTNFTEGSTETTGNSTDMMINGDGFFIVSKGGQDYYTRSGAFSFDTTGQMNLDGAPVQGWTADDTGTIDTTGSLSTLQIQVGQVMAAKASTKAVFGGNLDSSTSTATAATTITRGETVYDSTGNPRTLNLSLTKAAGASTWSLTASDGTNTTNYGTVTFDSSGALSSASTVTCGGVTVDLSGVTGYAGLDTLKGQSQDGNAAGTLQSFELGNDGTITGTFSNSAKQVLGKIALAVFTNPAGLEKSGDSLYSTTANSGNPQVGTASTGGRGSLTGGALEMSNVDLSTEFTKLIIAQRGFQANARVITTSDSVLEELINLKR